VAITHFGEASVPADNTASNAATQTVTPPASMTAGDLVFVTCSARNSTCTFSVGVDGGQTWNTLTAQTNTNLATQSFWCRFDGTWDASPRFDFSTTTCNTSVMQVFRPTDTAKLWDVDQAQSITTFTAATTITITGQTRAQASAVSIAHWVTNDDNSWGNLAGSGWSKTGLTAQFRNTGGNDSSQTFAYNIGTGASNNVSQDQTANGDDAGVRSIISFYEYDAGSPIVVDVPAGSLSLTGFAPTVLTPRLVQVPAGSLTLTAFAPTVLTPRLVSVPAGSLSLTGIAPSVVIGTNIQVPAGSLALTGFAPSVLAPRTIQVPAGNLALTGFAPSVVVGTIISVPSASLSLTGYAPTVLAPRTIDVPSGALVLTGFAPAVVVGVNVEVPQGSLSLTGFAPSVLTPRTIAVPAGSLTLTGYAPDVAVGINIAVPSGALSLTGYAPTVGLPISISVPSGNLSLTGYAPSVRVRRPAGTSRRWMGNFMSDFMA
jgi:hypothetical protein